ncbi:MAG: hypothetical protein EU541_07255 [Promethearchaeota archaeon]|nr:MAG: hypothetical protein EU541_07255 [Candidatus Lokiarchaeota archaeon]
MKGVITIKSITKQLDEIEQLDYQKLKEKELFKSDRLFCCILGLNQLETRIFAYLLKNKDNSTTELTTFFDKDRSTIQRALKTLRDLNLIKRQSMSLKRYSKLKNLPNTKKRGYLFIYNAENIEFVKERMRFLLDKWYDSMLDYLEHMDSLIDCYKENGELC